MGWGHIRILYKATREYTKPQQTIKSPDYTKPQQNIQSPKKAIQRHKNNIHRHQILDKVLKCLTRVTTNMNLT